jgi:hypothetical protein
MMAVAVFVVCGVTVFYTHRAADGRTSGERAAYVIGEKLRRRGAKFPTDAELNMMAQKLFQAARIRPTAELELAFENGYTDGFKKTHHRE